ncbi:MAG: T9SS type A sorting domain-containing protein [Candidatus Krumholzibacteriota bacterium]
MLSRLQPIHIFRITIYTMIGAGLLMAGTAPAQTYDWDESSGPEGGWVYALAEAPNGDVFAGLWNRGGVFRSTDQGVTWQEAGLHGYSISEMVTNTAGAVFAASTTNDVLRSLDGGSSWEVSGSSVVDYFGGIAYDPVLDILYAARHEQVSRSVNGGDSWENIDLDFPNVQVRALAAVPNGGYLYAGTTGDKVYRSEDGGVTWYLYDAGMTTNGIRDLLVVSEGFVYAASYGGGVYRTEWSGTTWTQFVNGLDDDYCMSIGRDASGSLWVGTNQSGTYVSHNDGQDWAAARTGLFFREVNDLLFLDANTFLAGCGGGGVFRSVDAGALWSPSNAGLNRCWISTLVNDGAGTDYAVAQGHGVHRSVDDGVTWTPVNSGLTDPDVLDIAIHPDGELFVGTRDNHLFISSNGADSWTPTGTAPAIVRAEAVAVKAATGDLFVGESTISGGVWRSPDKGDSWTQVSGGLPATGVTSLAVADDGDLLACVWDNGIYRSQDDGASWNPLNNGLTGLNVSQVISLPGGTMYAAVPYHGLFRSLNDGANWSLVDPSLDELTIRSVAANLSGYIFAGGEYEGDIYQSSDGGDSWTLISVPTFGVSIQSLGFDTAGRLLVGTNGWSVLYTQQSTPVYLFGFTAERMSSGAVTLGWSVSYDGPVPAAEVYRSVDGGPREQLSIRSLGSGPEFNFVDKTAPADPCDYWLLLTDAAESQSWFGPVSVDKADLAGVGLAIDSVWPNPATGSATIRFSVPRNETARLDVYDLRGRLVRRLRWGMAGGGTLEGTWDGRDDNGNAVAAGVYFLRLRTDNKVVTGRVVMLGN